MATVVKRHCRDHGGYFESPVRRGRPPVRCAPEYPCSAAETAVPATPKRTRKPTHRQLADAFDRKEAQQAAARGTVEAPESPVGASAGKSASLRVAKDAKSLLEAQGWSATGKGWTDEDGAYRVSVSAARGEELFHAEWVDGALAGPMQYSLWNTERISVNGAPNSNLPFDPDEIPDKRLVEYLAGMKLTWFNKLSQGTETAYAGKRIEIMHAYDGMGDEQGSDRMIRFIDVTGRGYRAFRLGALLKIGAGRVASDEA